MEEYVYLIGIIYPYGELNILGIYTNEKLLIEAYDKLITEDPRCITEKYPETPMIYKIPLNKFLGQKVEFALFDEKPYFYYEEECVNIDEIKSHVWIIL